MDWWDWKSQTLKPKDWKSWTCKPKEWKSQTCKPMYWTSQTCKLKDWTSQTCKPKDWTSQTCKLKDWTSQSLLYSHILISTCENVFFSLTKCMYDIMLQIFLCWSYITVSVNVISRLHIKSNIMLKHLSIGVVSTDQSYMPELVTVSVGQSPNKLREIKEVKIDK